VRVQLTHAASGCTIISGPGYQLGEGLSGLLDHMASDADSLSTGLLSRLASNVATLQQQQLQQLQQQCVAEAGGVRQQLAQEGGSGIVCCSSIANSKGTSQVTSRLGSISGAAFPDMPATTTPAAAAAPAPAVPAAGCVSSTAAAVRVSSSASGVMTPIGRPSSASAAISSAALATAAGGPAAAPTAQLLRSISNLSSRAMLGSNSAAGALAAAGLLQLSPGCYVPTPALLEKLLCRAGTMRWPPSSAVALATAGTGSREAITQAVNAAPLPTSATAAAGVQVSEGPAVAAGQPLGLPPKGPRHCRCSSRDAGILGRSAGQIVMPVGDQQPSAAGAPPGTQSGGDAQLRVGPSTAAAATTVTSCGTDTAHSKPATCVAGGDSSAAGETEEQTGREAGADQQQQQQHTTELCEQAAGGPTASEPGTEATVDAVAVVYAVTKPAGSPITTRDAGRGGAALAAGPAAGAGVEAAAAAAKSGEVVSLTGSPVCCELLCSPSLSKSHRATVDSLAIAVQQLEVLPEPPAELPAAAVAAAAVAAAAAAAADQAGCLAGNVVAAGGAGGFGRILVRRRFVRNLQPSVTHFKR